MFAKHQVEYQLNGIPNSFEFFLFVNPLGMKCYRCEKELLESLEQISSKVDVNILTYHNQATVHHFMEQLGIKHLSFDECNELYEVVYTAALAYKAASLQGKKLARDFLLRMQKHFNKPKQGASMTPALSREDMAEIANDIGLDVQIFFEDLDSQFVKKLFIMDQQIAREMNVNRTPALVIFQNQSSDDGVLLNEHITKETIIQELDTIVENYYITQTSVKYAPPSLSIIHKTEA